MSRMSTSWIGVAALALAAASCSGASGDGVSETTTTAGAGIVSSTTAASTSTSAQAAAPTEATTTSTVAPTAETRPRRGSTANGEPLAIPDPVPPTQGTASRYGVIGCSNTDQTVTGYLELSSKDLIFGGDLGGGSLTRWGDPGDRRYDLYWELFDERRPAEGYDGVWVQLCIRNGDHGGVFDESEATWVTHIVDQVHLRDAGVPIWISPINFYADGQVCSSVGPDGPAIAAMVADWAATNLDNVFRGPDFGPLAPQHIGVRDDCHPNDSGETLLGQQLVEFIDQA